MKKLSLIDKLIFILNSITAFVLLLSYAIPYISPEKMPSIAVLGLLVPILIFINILFLIYWLVKLKKQFLISLITLIIGFQHLAGLYKFEDKQLIQDSDLKIMTYNVRLFNIYNWIKEEGIKNKITTFIADKNPDIICFQEFDPKQKNEINLPYKHIQTANEKSKFGQAIYSKYKILKTGSLDFKNSNNNAIFIDFIKENDTIRVYNIHLESLKLNPKKEHFGEENNDKLRIRVEKAFQVQASQVTQILAHEKKCKYKTIFCGDFNNTSFSWVYKQLKQGKKDAFEIAGKGFGKTFNYIYPVRIDFILTHKDFEINNFRSYPLNYSDHFPIMARIKL